EYEGFFGTNYSVVALFDSDLEKINKATKRGIPILDVKELAEEIKKSSIDIIVLGVPASVAQSVLDQVVAIGIKAVLNFAPMQFYVPEGVKLKTVDLTVSFDSLSHSLVASEIEIESK
ncbi:MAG: redox-sensing transcriptional repressor, partial [bacterium]